MKNSKISLVLMVFMAFQYLAIGQTYNLNAPVPLDPTVKFGKLQNGLSYYIRANKLPENRAEFYIVHNVGAILEEDNQNGLAHFTEHMAFNGTKNYPDKTLLNYLESIGCKFGANVNAFTSLDVTSYNIGSVPLTREGIIDSCLLVLHDWSSFISFEQEELDSERGVIREEWRTRGGSGARLNDQLRPTIYKGSKYAKRDIIGDTAVINHFTRQDIMDYYHKWYRPDLQAVIIVGDFDASMMEEKVKKLFSAIPAAKNPISKPVYDVPNNNEPLVGIATDAEATNTMVRVYFKQDNVSAENKNMGYMRQTIVRSLINQMLNSRISEQLQKENTPCTQAFSGYNSFTETKDAFMAIGIAKNNQAVQTLEMLLTEARRMKLHGFTLPELERANANYLRSVESTFTEREKQKHNNLVWSYFGHFTDNTPTPGIEHNYEFVKQVLPGITLAEINTTAAQYITDNNIIVTVSGPEKEGTVMPKQDELLASLAKINNASIEAYEDKLGAAKLMATTPKKGTIKSEKRNDKLNTVEWTLSNGMKVVLKTTDFKADEVNLSGYSVGGSSLVEDKDLLTANMMGGIISEMGLGQFSKTELQKVLAGKKVFTGLTISGERENISGSASPKDIETMLQMVNLRFTQPRFDEQSFNTYLSRIRTAIENRSMEPRNALSDSITATLYNHHPRNLPITPERLNEITFENVKAIYNKRFSDPGSFTWLIVGNIQPQELKPMVEMYLASLPSINNKEKYLDRKVRMVDGKVKCHFNREMKTPKTSVFATYKGVISYTPESIVMLNALKNILDMRYVESIREKEGGTYGVGVRAGYSRLPIPVATLQMNFDTDPEKADHLIEILHKELLALRENGPSETDLQKVKEYFLKSHQDNLKENGYWMGVLDNFYYDNLYMVNDYVNLVNQLSSESLKVFMQKTFSPDQTIEVVMKPAL